MSHTLACHECDQLLQLQNLSKGEQACCPRCGASLMKYRPAMVDKVFAYSLAGLIFYVPANYLPVMTFEMLGLASTNTMLQGVIQLYHSGYLWMAFLVVLCSVVMPLVNLFLLFTISVLLKMKACVSVIRRFLVWQHHIEEWAMLEVYMLGILVAYIKMSGMGNIVIGLGMYCFVGMLLATILASIRFDTELAFEKLDEIKSL